METINFNTYEVSSFILNFRVPSTSFSSSFQNTAIVLKTVAPWTAIVKKKLASGSIPKRDFAISRCPELLTGKNSVSPWISPRIIASNQLIG